MLIQYLDISLKNIVSTEEFQMIIDKLFVGPYHAPLPVHRS